MLELFGVISLFYGISTLVGYRKWLDLTKHIVVIPPER